MQTGAPAFEPISVDQARTWLRVDGQDDDATIAVLIKAARRFIERRTNRALVASTWRLSLDRWPAQGCAPYDAQRFPRFPAIEVHKGPVTSISAVSFVDTTGAVQTLTANTDYLVDLSREPARITPAWGKAWPSARNQPAAITVDFAAGYADATAVPEDLTLALRLLVGHWYEHRESVTVGVISSTLEMAFDELVQPWRLWTFQ